MKATNGARQAQQCAADESFLAHVRMVGTGVETSSRGRMRW